jgi:hypothetical protein
VDYKKILEDFSLTKFPVALGGCRKEGNNFGCCEYNITVFDEKNEKDRIIENNGNSEFSYQKLKKKKKKSSKRMQKVV